MPKRALLSTLILLLGLAGVHAEVRAQPAPPAPAAAPAAPGTAAATVAPAAAAAAPAVVYAVAPAQGLRWPGAEARSLPVEAGAKLEIVAEQGDLIRVRDGVRFGWLPRAAVSTSPPAAGPPAATPAGAPALPGAPVAPVAPPAPAQP